MRFQCGVRPADAEAPEIEPQRRGRCREEAARVTETDLGDEIGAKHNRVAQDRRQPIVGARSQLAVRARIRKGDTDRRGRIFAVALAERTKQPVPTLRVVHARHHGQRFTRARSLAHEILCRVVVGRLRVVLQDGLRNRVDAVGRNHVAGKRIADESSGRVGPRRQRVVDHDELAIARARLRKIARPLQHRGDCPNQIVGREALRSFHVDEKEHLVLPDRPAQRKPVLIRCVRFPSRHGSSCSSSCSR